MQTCLLHLIRNTLRYASRKDSGALGKALRPVYTAPSPTAAAERFDEFAGTWGSREPAVIRLWRNAWEEFIGVPGPYDVKICRVMCSTDEIVNPGSPRLPRRVYCGRSASRLVVGVASGR